MAGRILLLAVIGVGVYFWGYFATTRRVDAEVFGEKVTFRECDSRSKAVVFTPATLVESLLSGRHVEPLAP